MFNNSDMDVRSAGNIIWHTQAISKLGRSELKRQRPCCIWLTGLSGAGKSTIANLLEAHLHSRGKHTYTLDGDNVRLGLNSDLGFNDEARAENIRRVAHVATLMVDAGLITITCLISPFEKDRMLARSLFAPGEFIEVFFKAKLDTCEQRDPKGLYRKARQGLIANFTGLASPYEQPQEAEIVVETDLLSPPECVDQIIKSIDHLI